MNKWDFIKLRMRGEKRHAVLLQHALSAGKMAGHSMDSYLERRPGMRVINLRMVGGAMNSMKKTDKVSRLMYRAGFITHEVLSQTIAQNERCGLELQQNVKHSVLEMFEGSIGES